MAGRAWAVLVAVIACFLCCTDALPDEHPTTITLRTQLGHTGTISAVALAPDGRLLLSTADDGTIKLWDARSGRLIRSMDMGGDARSAAFLPDAHYVMVGAHPGLKSYLAGSRTGVVGLWNVSTGEYLGGLKSEYGNLFFRAILLSDPNGPRSPNG